MDSKVKQMIKLIEEDADSFARRAEMYYKRRPELLKLVEDFYRAYRALAERYDHATGVIRHAHKTMVEAFPDQVQSMMNDDFDPDESQKDALGISSVDMHVEKRNPEEGSDFLRSRRGLKQLDFFEKGRARKSLNFSEAGEKERNMNYGSNNNANAAGLNDSKYSESKHETDILLLKEALAKLEAEKDAGLLQYQRSLERLSQLEKEVKLAQEESEKLFERASKAEAEVELLNGALIELKAEKELVHLQYQQCLDKISILEEKISHNQEEARETSDRADRAESEVQLLKQGLAVLQSEKEFITAQHEQCSETITVIETKLQQAEEHACRTNERAEMAERKVESLNLAIIKLTEEKEAYLVEYQHYRERISSLEFQILFSQEEAQRLNEEISSGAAKLKSAEEHCLSIDRSHMSLQSDLDLLIRKMESKNKELTEKQMELERLWTCAQEERLRFVEAETAFQTLQLLHNESREELTSLASELQNSAQTVLDLEAHNHCLQEEVSKIKDENRTLSEINLSSAVSMEHMQDEISTLRATISKLQEEIEIRVNERNGLQQEIDRLREDFNELKQKHGAVLEQLESLELDPASFGFSIMELRNNCSKLSDAYHIEKSEKVALLEKLDVMAKLTEKNAMLEMSMASLNTELQQVKEKVKTLEENCEALIEERSTIMSEKDALLSQFQVLTENSGALAEKNVFLESSLARTLDELKVSQENSRKLEESLTLIGIEKNGLLNKTETLSSQLEFSRHKLEETEINCEELELRNCNLLMEKQLLVCSIGELRDLLNSAKQENSDSAKLYQLQLANMERQLHALQEETELTQNCYIEELDASVRAEIEISILQTYLKELHENNSSLGLKCLKLFEAYQKSEKLIAVMEQKIADQLVESKTLYCALEKIKMGFFQMSKILEIDSGIGSECKFEGENVSYQTQLNQLLKNAEDIKKALAATLDENQQHVLEKSLLFTLLQQLRLEAADLGTEKHIISQNLKSSQLRQIKLLAEIRGLSETNEGLKKRLEEGDRRELMLRNDIKELSLNFLDLQGTCKILQQDNNLVLEEKKSLMKELSDLKDTNCVLEEELYTILGDALCLNSMLLVFKDFFSEKSLEFKELDGSMHQLHQIKDTHEVVIKTLEGKLETLLVERSGLRKSLEESDKELKSVVSINNKLNDDVVNGNELLCQKEMEFFEAQIKLEVLLNERIKMQRAVEDLKGEYNNIKVIKEKQTEQILKLLEDNRLKNVVNDDLRGSKSILEAELLELVKKHEIVKTTEATLKSELQRWEIKEHLCEKEFEELYRTLQISAVTEACYHEKFHELHEKLESMTSKISAADKEAQLLKDRIIVLEVDNAELKAHFAEYDSAVSSLDGAVASLESRTIFHDKLSKTDRTKDDGSSPHLRKQICVQEDNSNAILMTRCSELKNLQNRIQVVELAVQDLQRFASEGSPGSSIRAQASTVHTDEMESRRSFRLESLRARRRQRSHKSDASSEVTELPKDILLDHISDSSSYGHSKREILAVDNHMLELWGTTSKNSSDGMAQKLAGHRKQSSSSEIIAEKEVDVIDKLEISGSPKYRKKMKILGRLLFDAQKLANLQKTVQDLKNTVEISEKRKKTKGVIEYDTVKEQLEEAEEAIERLFGVNEKLTRTVEDDSISSKSLSENGSNESGIVRRRRVLEQIRRASEKISRLHFEVQKLQFLLLKLGSEKEETLKTKVITRSPRVRLRDYLYGGSRPVFANKQKRRHFCGCVRPSTVGD